METLYNHIRKIAESLRIGGKYKLHGIRVYFNAPPNAKERPDGANFFWTKYAFLFEDSKGDYYTYVTELDPWGTTKRDGGEDVLYADSNWGIDKSRIVTIKPKEVEQEFRKFLSPEVKLYPSDQQAIYVNENKRDSKNSYGEKEMKKIFDNAFYLASTKDGKLKNPFGSKSSDPEGDVEQGDLGQAPKEKAPTKEKAPAKEKAKPSEEELFND